MDQFRLAFHDTSTVEREQIMCVWNNPRLLEQAIFVWNIIRNKLKASTVRATHLVGMKTRACAVKTKQKTYIL